MSDVTNKESPDESPRPRARGWFSSLGKPLRSWLPKRSSVQRPDVDDLAQEVYLRLLRYADDIAVENPQGYLFRIAANVANEWRERARPTKPQDDSWLNELSPAADNPEGVLIKPNELVQAAIDQLPKRQREALLLHVNEGLTYKQIADRLGLTYRIVLRDLTRAYTTLRMQLRIEDL